MTKRGSYNLNYLRRPLSGLSLGVGRLNQSVFMGKAEYDRV